MRTVFAKLTLLQLSGGALGIAVLYLVMDAQFTRNMNQNYVRHGQVVAQSLARAVEPGLVNHDLTSVQSSLDAMLTSPDVEWIAVTGPDGEVLAHTLVPSFPPSIAMSEISRQKDGAIVTMPDSGKTDMVFSQPVLTGIAGEVHVAFSRENFFSAIHRMEWIILSSIAAVMLTIMLGFALVAHRIVAPIRLLTDAAILLGGNQRQAFAALPVRSRDDMGVLTRAFNRMVSELRSHENLLETRVRDRTEELVLANRDLGLEVEQRKRVESALRVANRTLRELIQASPVAIVAYDLEGLVQSWNPAAERLFGWNSNEVTGLPLPFVPADKLDEFHGRIERVLRGEDLTRECVCRVKKDGSAVELSIASATLRDTQGATVGLISVINDVTERQRAEEELRKAKAAAEEASRIKSEFLANMSHEIRTPMNGVIGMTDLVLETDLTEQQRDYLEMVKASAEGLLTVINDILDFSKIEAGRLELDPNEFQIRQTMEETAAIMSLPACRKGLELVIEVCPEVPEILIGDQLRLRQVLLNLLGNAIKFTDTGEIMLRVETEKITAEAARLHFWVKDTGIGIPADRQEQIFKAFTQADNSTTRKFGGTGLGLTITARLVELMGGRIWVQSEPGHGSVFHFTVTFPVITAEPSLPTLEPGNFADRRILVVDDNSTNCRVLEGILQNWGMRPTVAVSGAEALAMLQQAQQSGTPFSLVLTDVNMPDMNGFELAERIRQNSALAGAIILMLPSMSEPGHVARCRTLDVKACLAKPVRRSDLLRAIQAALDAPVPLNLPTPQLQPRPGPDAGAKLRILVAEDNAVNQVLVQRLLERQGHSVVVVSNGLEALAILEKQSFDVALMDLQMPEMGGIEAVQALRRKELSSGKHLPIIALTAHAMKQDEQRCLAAGMDGYISKPIEKKALFALLARVAESSSDRTLSRR